MLEQLRRVAGIWNWLPAFRAVAETEHLHRASEMLGVSPPALSRTIRLLEEAIGAPLFHRGGKHLELTDHGRVIAAATRHAMRVVDEAMATTASDLRLTGALRVSSQGRLTTVYLFGALARLRRDHPELVPHVTSASPSEIVPKLRRGDLDVALVYQPTPHPDIHIDRLGSATNGIYCGPTHPLHDVSKPALSEVLQHAFAVPEPREAGLPAIDGWPPEHPRRVGLYSSLLDGGIEACASGDLLSVFPDAIVSSFAKGDKPRRLPLDVVSPFTLYAMKRVPVVSRPGRAELLIDEMRSEVHALLGAQRLSPSLPVDAGTAGETTDRLPPIT